MIPQPNSSTHAPLSCTSNSHDGWVKGKYASTHRDSTSTIRRKRYQKYSKIDPNMFWYFWSGQSKELCCNMDSKRKAVLYFTSERDEREVPHKYFFYKFKTFSSASLDENFFFSEGFLSQYYERILPDYTQDISLWIQNTPFNTLNTPHSSHSTHSTQAILNITLLMHSTQLSMHATLATLSMFYSGQTQHIHIPL